MVKLFVPYEQLSPFADLFIGRRDDFAWQRSDGRYRRAGSRVNLLDLGEHLAGRRTMGTYVIDEQGLCSFAVFDADMHMRVLDDPCLRELRIERRMLAQGQRRGMDVIQARFGRANLFAPVRRTVIRVDAIGIVFAKGEDQLDVTLGSRGHAAALCTIDA